MKARDFIGLITIVAVVLCGQIYFNSKEQAPINVLMEQKFLEFYGPTPSAEAIKGASDAETKEAIEMWETLRGAFLSGRENFLTAKPEWLKGLASAAARGRYHRFLIECQLKPQAGCPEY